MRVYTAIQIRSLIQYYYTLTHADIKWPLHSTKMIEFLCVLRWGMISNLICLWNYCVYMVLGHWPIALSGDLWPPANTWLLHSLRWMYIPSVVHLSFTFDASMFKRFPDIELNGYQLTNYLHTKKGLIVLFKMDLLTKHGVHLSFNLSNPSKYIQPLCLELFFFNISDLRSTNLQLPQKQYYFALTKVDLPILY